MLRFYIPLTECSFSYILTELEKKTFTFIISSNVTVFNKIG